MSIEPDRLSGLSPEAVQLVIEHLWMVKAVAARIRRAAGRLVSMGDLHAWGEDGLLEVAAAFNPAEGKPFAMRAWGRVEGAMRDGLRKERRTKNVRLAMEAAGTAFHESASGGDMLAGMALADVARSIQDEAFGLLAARAMGIVSAIAWMSPEDRLIAEEEWMRTLRLLKQVRADLPTRDREILRLHHDERLSLQDIATAKSQPYSTVTRHHRDALIRLGERLRKLGVLRALRAPEGER